MNKYDDVGGGYCHCMMSANLAVVNSNDNEKFSCSLWCSDWGIVHEIFRLWPFQKNEATRLFFQFSQIAVKFQIFYLAHSAVNLQSNRRSLKIPATTNNHYSTYL